MIDDFYELVQPKYYAWKTPSALVILSKTMEEGLYWHIEKDASVQFRYGNDDKLKPLPKSQWQSFYQNIFGFNPTLSDL